MSFAKYLNEQDMSWRNIPKRPDWPVGHPNYKKYDDSKPKKPLATRAGKLVKKMGKKAAKATGKMVASAGYAAGSALATGFSKLFGMGKQHAAKKAQNARNEKRRPAIEAGHAKMIAKRKSLEQKLPKNMKKEMKNKILSNIRGVRSAVRRFDDTQLTAMHAKHAKNDTPLRYSLKAELKTRAQKKKRQATKMQKAVTQA
jgi:hypothetical protein